MLMFQRLINCTASIRCVDSGGESRVFLLLRFDLLKKNLFTRKVKCNRKKEDKSLNVKVCTINLVSKNPQKGCLNGVLRLLTCT